MNRAKLNLYGPILLIVFLASVFRLTLLDKIPKALNGDELVYVVTAKSVWLTGHDLSGTWNPLSAFIFHTPPHETAAELPYFINLPFSGPLPFSLLTAKLPYAILSVGIVVLIYAITAVLFGSFTGIITGLVAAVNPWLVVIGRTGYEFTPATFFYLLGLYMLLKTKGWKILWSFLPFALAFYSYIGTKIILLPFVMLASLLAYVRHGKKQFKPYIVLSVMCIIFILGFLYQLKTAPNASRFSELVFPNSPIVIEEVNRVRQDSLASPLIPLVTNRYVVYIRMITSKLFDIFSPAYLFVDGDLLFLPIRQSFFYYIDAVFLIAGLLYLYVRKRLDFLFISLFALIGTFPQIFHNTVGNYSLHVALMFPFLIMLIGVGIANIADKIRGRFKIYALMLIGLLYVGNVFSFSMIYLFQFPKSAENDFSMRILTRYISFALDKKKSITFYSTVTGDLFKKYLFYSNTLTPKNVKAIAALNMKDSFTFDGIQFTDCDPTFQKPRTPDEIDIYDRNCKMGPEGKAHYVSRLIDGGQVYGIINDLICNQYNLNEYPMGITIQDLSIEKLSVSDFCTKYITK